MNYGKPIKLNCVEAFAGALYLAGFDDDAERILQGFKYGGAFFAINEALFEKYKQCSTHEEMAKGQEEMQKVIAKAKEENRNR